MVVRFIRNAYVAVGVAGTSAALLGLLTFFYPHFASAMWPFSSAQAAEGDQTFIHDPALNLLEAAVNPDPDPTKGDTQLSVSDSTALVAEGGADATSQAADTSDTNTDGHDTATTGNSPETKPTPVKKPAAKPIVKAPVKTVTKAAEKPVVKAAIKSSDSSSASVSSGSGYFSNPLPAGHLSQGLHGHNAVDIAAPAGTPIYAAASGDVTTVHDDDGWNGGYGNYIIISHPNGTSTLYSHMSQVVATGGSVSRGEVVGYVGRTGEATGNHLHFEVHGATNPFAN